MKLKSPLRTVYAATAFAVLLVATTIFAQQFSAPTAVDQTTAKLVCQMIPRYHISRKPIDDEISKKLLHRYVEVLDPQKLYFLQSDIDKMQRYRTELDDLLKSGDVRFGYDTFDLYLKRLNERTKLAHRLIDADFDFTRDESMIIDPDALSWAKTKEELDERWRKRIKYQLLSKKLEKTPLDKARKELNKRYDNIRRIMNQSEGFEKLEMYLSALTHCFDPHSSYLSPQSLEEFRIAMELSLEGIGAALRSEDGYTTVAEIVPGGAADLDGRLEVGDKIVAVAQGDEEFVDIVEMKLSKVVHLIRGKRGTVVRLRIKKADSSESEIYALTRRKIELKSAEVKGEIIQSETRTRGARIGVIHIPSFYRDFRGEQRGDDNFKSTARDLERVLNKFRSEGGVDGLVVDLRTNGGGALSEAIDVSGLFVDSGPIVQVKDEKGRIKTHNDEIRGELYTGPLVVVINRLSASASEIFAGAMRDYGRAIIVGDTTTHGKGTVQNVMPVGVQMFQFLPQQDRGALKLTIQQFYRVNGDSTQNRGVHSDIVLPSRLDHMDVGESFLDNALAFDHVPPANHQMLGMVNAEIVTALKKASQARIAKSPDFQKLEKRIEQFVERKNRKTISLNEEVLKKEREAEGADDDDENDDLFGAGRLGHPVRKDKKKEDKKDEATDATKSTEGKQAKDEPLFPDDTYNNEILQITADYIALLKGPTTAKTAVRSENN